MSGNQTDGTAKFYAVGSFLLRSRNLFVIVGDILEGEIVPGMEILVPLQGELHVTSRVAQVEYVDVIHEKKSYIGLAIAYEDTEELEFWRALEVSGETLDLRPA